MEKFEPKLYPDTGGLAGGAESAKKDQLEKVNAALAEMGSGNKWRKAPEFQSEYESLVGKKVLMVDDTFMAIENILPDLTVATDGNAKALHYKGQSLEELVSEIMSQNPDVLILDYHLSDELKGITVFKELRSTGFTGKVVGCSSDREKSAEFIRAGAVGNIDKISYPSSNAVINLAELVK